MRFGMTSLMSPTSRQATPRPATFCRSWPNQTEITVAGNLIDIYQRVVVGSDLEIRGAANSPSLLIDALAIAGR